MKTKVVNFLENEIFEEIREKLDTDFNTVKSGLRREHTEIFQENLGEKIQSDMLKVSGDLYQEILKLNCKDYLIISCDCGDRSSLWKQLKFKSSFYGIDTIYILETKWCNVCGDEFSNAILKDTQRI